MPSVLFEEESPKAEILQAALQEFAEFGKQGARMQSIADRAGVNKALLHYYFSSKDNLHQEVLRRVFALGITRISSSFDDSLAPGDQIRLLVRNYFSFLRLYPALPRLMITEMSSHQEDVTQLLLSTFQQGNLPIPSKLIEVIQRGIASGDFRRVDPRQFLITVIGSAVFYFIAQPILQPILHITDEETFIARRATHLEELLLAGLERKV